jgi:hypothetical protein
MSMNGLNWNQLAALFSEMASKDGQMTTKQAQYHTGMLLDQPGGLFDVPGLENEVISTHLTPQGVGSALQAFAADTDDPRYPLITGWQPSVGNMPVYPCDDAPTNFMKGGNLTAQFGRVPQQTNTIEIDRVLHKSRSSSTNLQLIGAMLGNDTLAAGGFPTNPLNAVIAAEMIGVGVGMERNLAPMTWTGNIANNTAGGGYMEFPGLDRQIVAGHMDADTGTLMPAADSLVLNFAYNYVDGVVLDIVEYLSSIEYHMFHLASRTRVAPVEWVIVMRPELWQYLTMVWPCRYNTNRCSNMDGNNPVVINDDANIRFRDAMRQGMYIDINGRRYRVITDDGIYEQTNANDGNVPAGSFASTIYWLPLKIRGNMPITYWEYIDYRQVRTELAPMGGGSKFVPFWTDNGRFLWVTEYVKWCLDMTAKIEPRVVLRAPHLAAKLTNVMYTPLVHLRDWNPDSPYWQDGGVSIRGAGTSYAVWK